MRDPLTEPKRQWGTYVTPTLLKGFLAGDHECLWKLWFCANYDFEKMPMDEDDAARLKEWNKQHDAQVQRRAQLLRDDGFTVKVEHRVKIKFDNGIVIRGDLDILAMKQEFIHIWDEKTGKRRLSDHEQVRIYLALLPLTTDFNHPLFKEEANEYQGFVEYTNDRIEDVLLDPAGDLDRLKLLLREVLWDGKPTPGERLERKPSKHECLWCKVKNCPDRFGASTGQAAF